MKKKILKKENIKCWEYFHCSSETQKACLMSEVSASKCWVVNIACCKMDKDTPRPLSVKHVVCKTCDFYKTYHAVE